MIREFSLDSVDKIALHSQNDVKICSDASLESIFEANLYSDMSNFRLKEDPTDFLTSKFRRLTDTFRYCSLFLMRQSTYHNYAAFKRTRPPEKYFQYVMPVSDIAKNKYSLAFSTAGQKDAFLKQLKDEEGNPTVDFKSVLVQRIVPALMALTPKPQRVISPFAGGLLLDQVKLIRSQKSI